MEIRIPINPVTGGVNKSVFYGTQPMHSHIQDIKQEIEKPMNSATSSHN